jgi:DNA-binding Lrp family transcriptional regulator
MSVVLDRVTSPPPREMELARLSFAFLLDEMAGGIAGLEPVDALLVMAVNQANIAPLTRDPDARARYGQLDTPAPDADRRPVSVNAVAASLGLPFETVRRRLRRLAAADVCRTTAEGVVAPASFLASPPYLQSVVQGHGRLRAFYDELLAAGLVEDLPPPAYAPEPHVPVRAAARLLSDYVLRTSEGLMREAGNVISTLILTALLAYSLRTEPAPLTVKAIAEPLALPVETVRRHLIQLAEDGLCERAQGGSLMTAAVLSRPGLQALFSDNAKHVQRLLAGLAERGVIRAWDALRATAGAS